ncbi:MAG: hypothetical protein WA102_00960 [Candidatus Methanoperedens sp.]
MVENELHLLIEYFKSLRNEIDHRIIEHTRLVYLKVLSIGAIIFVLVERFYAGGNTSNISSLWPYFFWTVPLVAIIFDFLIASNIRVINNLCPYIKDHFEKKSFRKYVSNPEFRFWEECAASADSKYHCYTCGEMVAIWTFSVASSIFSMILQSQVGFNLLDKVNIILIVLCVVGLLSALWHLVWSIKMEREFLYPEIGNVPNIEWRKV